jgi:hypothetical protein
MDDPSREREIWGSALPHPVGVMNRLYDDDDAKAWVPPSLNLAE